MHSPARAPGAWDIRPIGLPGTACDPLPDMRLRGSAHVTPAADGRSGRIFYAVFLPLAVAANLGLGLLILSYLRPVAWIGDLELATGAFCCAVAGWLAAAAWSKSYWGAAMARRTCAERTPTRPRDP